MIKKFIFLLIAAMVSGHLFLSCSKKDPAKIDITVSQEDIDLVILHKRNIDKITGKYDLEMQKTKKKDRAALIEKGKAEINKYLESKDLSPVVFMRKSKKILKGYLAFQETSEKALEQKAKMLEKEELKESEFKTRMDLYKKAGEAQFKELTTDLNDYEIQLIKSNLKNLEEIMK